MTVRANLARSILLRHTLTESRVNYLCNVTEVESGEKRAVNQKVFAVLKTVTGLLPDTAYRVDCVAYRSDGVEYCLEANTTVTTRELCAFSTSDSMYVIQFSKYVHIRMYVCTYTYVRMYIITYIRIYVHTYYIYIYIYCTVHSVSDSIHLGMYIKCTSIVRPSNYTISADT